MRSKGAALICALLLPAVATASDTTDAGTGLVQGASVLPITGKINNGLTTNDLPAVALFTTLNATCTATLIGCQTALTAAHCVCPDGSTGATCAPNPAAAVLFFQHSGFYALSNVAVHPGWNGGPPAAPLGVHDLAVLRLAAPVAGVQPVQLNSAAKPANGTQVLLAGFGATQSTPVGIKRLGLAELVACTNPGSTPAVCFDFKAPIGPPGQDSNTCAGDSGGPVFTSQAGALALAAATSGGNATCAAPDQSVNSDIFADRAWIQAQAAGDLGQSSCGGLPNAGSSAGRSAGAVGTLSAATPTAGFTFEVPPGTTTLFVSLNAENYYPGANDFDLYLNHGAPPTPSDTDCASEVEGALEGCAIPSPQAGTWHILANRFSGQGLFQVTATAYTSGGSGTTPCARDADTACLLGGRFEVEVDWRTSSASGVGQVMSFGGQRTENEESVFWWFFGPTNFEMGVKMLNACVPALGNKFWVFVSGLTNQGWTVRVRDTQTGATRTYQNPTGQLSETFADVAAFNCP